jgi:hypothetical protein
MNTPFHSSGSKVAFHLGKTSTSAMPGVGARRLVTRWNPLITWWIVGVVARKEAARVIRSSCSDNGVVGTRRKLLEDRQKKN